MMATAVDSIPAGLCLSTSTLMTGDKNKQQNSRLNILNVQNCYLSYHVIRNLLRADNLNGLHRYRNESRFIHEIVNEKGFREGLETIEKVCKKCKEDGREKEMDSMISTLDLSDASLCSNYQLICHHLMSDRIRFGRIGLLFFFTFILCKRLHRDGRQKHVESVIDWLAEFLNEAVSPWLIRHHNGQWVSVV